MNPKDNRADEVEDTLAILAHQVYLDAHAPGYTKLHPKNQKHLAEAKQAITALIERREKAAIRATNISQIENWRNWISDAPEYADLVKEMDEAIALLKDPTLTDENGVYLGMVATERGEDE